MKVFLLALLMTFVSAAPQWFENPASIIGNEGMSTKFARQVDPAEYAATMYRTGELPLTEAASRADYPSPGTPEYAAMMLARSSEAEKAAEPKANYPLPGTPEYAALMLARSSDAEKAAEPKANYPLPGTPEYAAMMLARSSAEKVEPKADSPLPGTPEYLAMMEARAEQEAKIDPKTNPAEYARMMQRQSEAAQARATPAEIDPAAYAAMMTYVNQKVAQARIDPQADPIAYAAMMAYQNKKEAQARIDPQADPVAYAAMMAYQQKSDPAYYAAMAARSGEQQPDAAAPTQAERFLLQNVTQLIGIVQSAVKQELSSTINILSQLKNNLTSLINQQKQNNPVTVFVRDQQSSAQYPFNFEQKQHPVYILVRPASVAGSSRPYYPASAFYPGPEYFFGNNRRFEKQLVADEVDYA